MTIELPDVKIGSQPLTGEQARIELACGLYAGWKVSIGQAMKIANMPKIPLMEELARRGIAMHYRMDDLEHDLRMAGGLSRKAEAA